MGIFSTAKWLDNERELIEGMRSDDARLSAQAQTVYVTAYTHTLFLILRRYAVSDANAEDLCQQTWEEALPRLRDGRYVTTAGKSSRSWLIGIALNLARQWKRSWMRDLMRCTKYRQQQELAPRSDASPEDDLAGSEARARIRSALKLLPPAQREAVTQLYIHGIHDAAERKRLSANACKGLQKLKLILEAEELGHVDIR